MSEPTKVCPICGESILAVAVKCRYCGEFFDPALKRQHSRPGQVDSLLLPVGRPISAIAAGYLAMFSVVPIFGLVAAIPALICGLSALKEIKRDPSLRGKGRAWFGIIAGGLFTVLWGLLAIVMAIGLAAEAGR
jgi:hypothetical protein